MFLITNNSKALNSLLHYQVELSKVITKNKIFKIDLSNGYKLFWTSVKPSDNLNIYNDAIVIGKANFEEKIITSPQYHNCNKPKELNTLLQSCVLKFGSEININPNEQFNVYYSRNSISDYQLLIAKDENLMPDFLQVSILGSVGYFPGDLTLFKEIKKVSYLKSLNFLNFIEIEEQSFQLEKNDDNLLINRYKEIIPENVNTGLNLSGGLDCRFVLGLLLSKNIKPTVYSRSDGEDKIVEELSEKLSLEHHIGKGDSLDEYSYTLTSDARIYYRGGNYNQLKEFYKPDEILQSGLWSASIENMFKTAWKKPGKLKNIFSDLINYALLNNLNDNTINGMNQTITKFDLKESLNDTLSYQKNYYDFSKRKQWAGWFYHINRGLNWTNATMADASFYTYPIYLLGDKRGMELSLGSTAYSNFYKERIRKINQNLFNKDLHVDYSGGRSFNSKPPLIVDAYKLYYEYGYKIIAKLKDQKKFYKGYDDEILSGINLEEHRDFSKYFIDDLKSNLSNNDISYGIKRIMVTLNNVLKFLNN